MNSFDYFIGIDPGMSGAVSIIGNNGTEIYPMPLTVTQDDIDSVTINRILRETEARGKTFVILEKAQAMTGQGVTGVFTYGKGYGKILAVLELSSVPFAEVHPTKWKKAAGLSIPKIKGEKDSERKKKLKRASVDLALKLFPGERDRILGPRGGINDGIAESLLLADYGRRIYR